MSADMIQWPTWEDVWYWAQWGWAKFSQLHPYVQLGIGTFVFLYFARFFIGRAKTQHQKNVKKSKGVMKKVGRIKNPNKQVLYLRKIDHFLFEEVVLTALNSMGFKIKRNSAYTGDGGIDGEVKIKGKWYLIQSKRYSNYIDKTHVEEFLAVCRARKQPGLFIHTGQTGKETAAIFQSTRNVHCVSGHLLSLMFDKKRRKFWFDYVAHHKI